MTVPSFYLTTPIYYANARPHIGSAYTTIACDAIARYKRMCGYDVAFLTGSDEHGEKLRRAAEEAGVPVERFVAEKRELFKELWRTLGIGDYRFVHTSQNLDHVRSVQWMIERAQEAGYIEKKKYEGRYCIFDERYVAEGTAPATCDICGRPAELVAEDNYFFKLSAFQDRLLGHYRDHPEFVQPGYRRNEVRSFVEAGLRDISISRRRLKWGIPWPGDPEQVVYVWYDALTSYLTGIGFRGAERSEDFKKYWPQPAGAASSTTNPHAEVVHMIGKDILRFHAVYWPAFLWAAGLPLPKTIFAHGWIYYEQEKMSKSKGNVVYPEPVVAAIDELAGAKVGNDALRYYLLRDVVFGQDGNFSRDGLLTRYNADLANGLGNLSSRVLTMVSNSRGGAVPRPAPAEAPRRLFELSSKPHLIAVRQSYERFEFSDALTTIWGMLELVDKFLVEEKPWAATEAVGDQERLDQVLYAATESLRILAVLSHPVIPDATERIWQQLGQEGKLADQRIDQLEWGGLKPGTRVARPEPVFPRLDKKQAIERIENMEEEIRPPAPKEPVMPSEGKQPERAESSRLEAGATTPARISIDDFAKVDLRVGEVKTAERVAGTDRLMKLTVDIGSEVRQLVAGIAQNYTPEQLVGRKVVVVANLEPRKLRGVESNGMVVAATRPDGGPVLCAFTEEVPVGSRLK